MTLRSTVLTCAVLAATGLGAVASATAVARSQAQQQPTYTIYAADSRRTLPFRAEGGTDTVSLDQLASLFQFTVTEDLLVEGVVGGLTVITTGQRVLLIPGQSWAQVSGDVRSLSGSVDGSPGAWRVPIDFLSRALGPAMGTAIQIRRSSRLVIVGDIRVPAVSGRIDQRGDTGELTLDIQPATPHEVTRDGSRLTVRFDAEALDMGAIVGAAPDFFSGTQVNGATIQVQLGASAAVFEADEDRDDSRLTIEVRPAPAPRPVGRPVGPREPPPVMDLSPPGEVRVVVLDPGHGGADQGARGADGLVEKTLTLRIARLLKNEIESRMGLTVLLTREGDEEVSLDRRSALANNFKADLFISLHANASFNTQLAGAEIISLSQEDYAARAPAITMSRAQVTVLGGGTRAIEAVPWDLAQLPHADESATLAGLLVRQMAQRNLPLFAPNAERRPLRALVGANMPAVLIEMGFLSNAADARALAGGERLSAIADAVLGMIAEVRHGIPPSDEGGDGR